MASLEVHLCSPHRRRHLRRWVLPMVMLVVGVFVPFGAGAHPAPNSILLLDVSAEQVVLEANIPLPELALVLGPGLEKNPEVLTNDYAGVLGSYLKAHVSAYVDAGHPWQVAIKELRMEKGKYADSNLPYWEVVAQFVLLPNAGESTRKFTLVYDAVMHQVVNHVALISIRRDWEGGIIHGDTTNDVSVIGWNLSENNIPPLEVSLDSGSRWKGFRGMVVLGMQHIKEGTDHILFLITLLLAAPLVVVSHRWKGYGGFRYSLVNLLKVVTAFTVGHSFTLLAGALNVVHFAAQPIEVLIAFSILISAVHALRPIFPGREMYVAAGFGLIHGLAFADTLSNLNLDGSSMALSILGFNVGIELMQLVVVALVMPWLIILSRSNAYPFIRMGGGVLAGVAALAWMTERISGGSNLVVRGIEQTMPYFPVVVGLLAVAALAYAVWGGETAARFELRAARREMRGKGKL